MSHDSEPIEILVVDDEPSTRLLLKRWIERSLPAKVREACDGLQALEQISQGGVEMLISDINMPVLNGIEMLSLLQADPSRKRMEVLIASQVAQEQKVRQAIELGVSDYLLKPLQYDWVIERLKRAAQKIYDRRRTGRGEDASSHTRILLADADPNFCAFAESALATEFHVQTARTVAETLVKAMRFHPDVLLFSPAMPGLTAELLLERLARLTGAEPPPIYELTDGAAETSAEGVTGAVKRTFVPETLRSQLMNLLRDGEIPDHGVLSWAASLKGEMRTALFQALGMLTGVEPEPLEQEPEPDASGAYGWIEIRAADDDFTMRLDIECSRDLPLALMAAMMGQEPGLDDGAEPPLDAIEEILNVVAGRLKSSCSERKIAVSVNPAVAGFEPPPPRAAQFEHHEWFRWSAGRPFRVRLAASPSNAGGKAS